jgi:predicted ATPase/DNA-binding SARP family transcriptional activator
VEVRVLGPVELVDGDATVRLPPAERTVLAALASRLGERVAVDVLVEALWPNQAPPSARKTLQVHVTRLRHAVGASAILQRDGGYLLDPNIVDVDATRLAAILVAAREAMQSGDAETAVGLFADATAMFRGEPYEGIAEGALPAGEIARLHESRATLAEDTIEAELACGRGSKCVAVLEAFVQANPYRERAWALLMRSLYQAGRPADALAAFSRARVLLAAELGIEPGPTLRDIERAILTHDAGLTGEPTKPARLGVANLPASVSPLIGRELELATLDPLAPGERLVTLTGVGGIGKTRLAIAIASDMTGRFACGPFFVDLAAIHDVELVPAAVAAALGIDVEPGADVTATVRSAVGAQSLVLVVDNCEHLLPGIADLVSTLVTSSAGIQVLATSREPLGIAGERVCPIDPLRVPPPDASLEQIATCDAGALFLARLPMNLTTAPLNADELSAVGTICRHLDGLPLGLELAAARSRTLSLPELAERLGHSIDELAASRHGVLPRHRTMRAALDWGYQLLSPPAQTALRAMSVCAGGCDLDAFSAICIDSQNTPAIDVLDELVRTSYITVDFTTTPTRYRLLEPVRQHAYQLLEEADETVTRHRRHLDHYLNYVRNHTRDVNQLGCGTDIGALRREVGNFRVALDWAEAHPDDTESGLRLVARLSDLWEQSANQEEGLARTEALLNSGRGSGSARSEAAFCASFLANDIGNVRRDQALTDQAFAEAQAGGDRLGEARARRSLSEGAAGRGDMATALAHLEIALQIAVDEGHDILRASSRNSLAAFLRERGQLDEAEQLLNATLAEEAVLDAVRLMAARRELALILRERGDYNGARAYNTTVLEQTESNFNLEYVISVHLELAAVECADHNAEAAANHLAAAEALQTDTSRMWDRYFAVAKADLAMIEGDHAAALAHAEHANAIVNHYISVYDDGTTEARFTCLRPLGDAQLALDRPADALATFQRVIDLAAQSPCRRAEGHEGAAAAALALGQLEAARSHLATANQIRRGTGSRRARRPAVEQHLARVEPASQPPTTRPEITR